MMHLIYRFGTWWCRRFHHSITRPVMHRYHCLTCGRSYEVNF